MALALGPSNWSCRDADGKSNSVDGELAARTNCYLLARLNVGIVAKSSGSSMYLRMFVIGRTLVHQTQSSPKEVFNLVVLVGDYAFLFKFAVDTFLILLRVTGIMQAHKIFANKKLIRIQCMRSDAYFI